MLKKLISLIAFFIVLSTTIYAQDVANTRYSPYSIYGIGDLYKQGGANTKGMAYIGLASRNKRFLNHINPAAVSARDTLAFLADLGMDLNLGLYRQGNIYSSSNIVNVSNISFSVPIYKKLAFYLGLSPYSSVAYNMRSFNGSPEVIARTGTFYNSVNGRGSLYNLYSGIAYTLWNKYSLGLELNYYFGNITKSSNILFQNSSYRNFNHSYNMKLSALAPKIGFQYEENVIKDYKIILGVTYKPSVKLAGDMENVYISSIQQRVDTVKIDNKSALTPKLGNEIALGLSLNKSDKFFIEFDYILSDWRNSNMDKILGFSNYSDVKFQSSISHSFRLGLEYTPNIIDTRYYSKRMSYRLGTYYNTSYYNINGTNLNSIGITLGATFPIFRFYNGISVAFDFERRQSPLDNLVKEYYATINISFNINDLWFIKPKYE